MRKSARDLEVTYSSSKKNIVIPRRKAGQSMRLDTAPVVITARTLERYYCMPLKEAASRLGICVTSMKTACRKFGIRRWPFRRFHLMNIDQQLEVEARMHRRISNTRSPQCSAFATKSFRNPSSSQTSYSKTEPHLHDAKNCNFHQYKFQQNDQSPYKTSFDNDNFSWTFGLCIANGRTESFNECLEIKKEPEISLLARWSDGYSAWMKDEPQGDSGDDLSFLVGGIDVCSVN